MKTRIAIGVSLIVVVLAMANLFVSHAQQAAVEPTQLTGNGAPPLSNPLKVALLKWYAANRVPTQFAVGQQPYGLAFDGANIWAANFADNTVSKVQASDGTVLGTFPAGGFEPYGVTFDGANVWVSNLDSGNVSKLRASDGKLLGTFPVPSSPPGWMAFDGANIWVPNGSSLVTKLRADDGKNMGNFNAGVNPIAAAFDGANVWVVDGGGIGTGTVTKLRASDGTVLGTFPVGLTPLGIAFDGDSVWVTNGTSGTVSNCGLATVLFWVRST